MRNHRQEVLWRQAVAKCTEGLSDQDREFFLNQSSCDVDQIINSLSQVTEPAGQHHRVRSVVSAESIAKIKSLTKLLSTFTSSVPEVSTTIWISVSLLNERGYVNSETRKTYEHALQIITSAVPHFNVYHEVFADMEDVEKSMVEFYSRVITLFLVALNRMKQSSHWTSRMGVDAAPIGISKAVESLQKQKEIVEKQVEAANLILQYKRHREIREILEELRLSQPTSNVKLPCHVIPYSANPLFRGRQEILDQMKHHLIDSRQKRASFAISGLGGVGKTQIALRFIYDNLESFPAVLWMQSDTHQKLAESFASAAKRLRLEPENSEKDADIIATALKTWLGECEVDWLLIFDNADDLKVLKPFWPQGNKGAIIVTSRNPAAIRAADVGILVSPLGSEEAAILFKTLLASRGPRDQIADPNDSLRVHRITRELGYLPLAIVQVSSFILECDCTLQEFEGLYHSSRQSNQSILDLETSSVNLFYEHSLATVWRVSILKLGKSALKLLRLMTCFDPDGVPESLFWEGAKTLGKELAFLKPGFAYHTAVQDLISRGLITKTETGATTGYSTTKARSLTVHRLVQETVFHQLSEEEEAGILQEALAILLAVWPVNHEDVFHMNALWPVCSLYLPHVLALEARCRAAPYLNQPSSLVELLFYASWYLYERRMSEFAFPLLETARTICARNGDTDPFFPKLMTAYGAVCLECDRLADSVTWFSQVVEIYRLRFSECMDQPDKTQGDHVWLLATSLSDWGCACTGMGKLEEAERLFLEALSVVEKIRSEKTHKDWRVHIAHNLSRLYTELNQPEESLELQFEYGDEFANGVVAETSQRGALMLYGIGNACLALVGKGGPDSSEKRRRGFEYHRRSLRIRQQVCGEHFITAVSLHKVGVLLYEGGDHADASEILERAISIFDQSFMATREKARSLFYLSLTKACMGKTAEAESLLSESWAYVEEVTSNKRNADNERDRGLFDSLVLYVHN
ncbi:TPR [Fusarium circinatum]|uniref:TPR n=1 Tax=Fusarium circinatum TaxID=48490 RepID=A0A8H5UDV6_FUSCI|nr:TPR [Fusarium circinatum]